MSINVSYSKVNRSVPRPTFEDVEPAVMEEMPIDSSDDPIILTLEDEYK